MTPQELATYGAGIVALSVVFSIFWNRSKKDLSIDDRVIRQLDERDETIRELKERESKMLDRNREINDRLYDVMKESMALATTHGQQIMAAVADVRKENHETAQRLHVRLEHTNAALDAARVQLEDCEASHAECKARMDRVEARVGMSGQIS